jgi:hypothetical protein
MVSTAAVPLYEKAIEFASLGKLSLTTHDTAASRAQNLLVTFTSDHSCLIGVTHDPVDGIAFDDSHLQFSFQA